MEVVSIATLGAFELPVNGHVYCRSAGSDEFPIMVVRALVGEREITIGTVFQLALASDNLFEFAVGHRIQLLLPAHDPLFLLVSRTVSVPLEHTLQDIISC